MIRKFLVRVWIGWLLGLALVAGSQGYAAAEADGQGQSPDVLYRALIEASSGDRSTSAAQELPPPLTSETTYQSESAFEGFGVTARDVLALRPIQTRLIRVTIDDLAQFGYLAEPADGPPVAAVLLIPEWWGVNESIKTETDHLASLGYRVFAVDLFAGRTATDRRRATELVRSVRPEDALERIGLWAQWLMRPAVPGAAPLKLGVAGWGWGANLALQYALEGSPVSALALFYGEVVLDSNRLEKLKCPLLGIYALRDGWVTPQRVDQFKDALAQAHVGFSIVSYDVPSGFMLKPATLTEQRAASDAGQSLDSFLARHLGGLAPAGN